MANIIPYDDTPIVDEKAVAKKHGELVENLKQSLYVGQAGFIKAGQFLSEIKSAKTYKSEDSTHDRELTTVDLQAEVADGGQTIAQSNACACDNIEEVDAFRCSDCKKFFKKDPRIKEEDDDEDK